MKRTRKKHNAVIKAKGWWWRRSGGTGRSPSCWTGRRAFSKAAVARAHVSQPSHFRGPVRFKMRPARLAPAMISTLGHRVPRRRQRGAPPALAPFGPDRP